MIIQLNLDETFHYGVVGRGEDLRKTQLQRGGWKDGLGIGYLRNVPRGSGLYQDILIFLQQK